MAVPAMSLTGETPVESGTGNPACAFPTTTTDKIVCGAITGETPQRGMAVPAMRSHGRDARATLDAPLHAPGLPFHFKAKNVGNL